VTAFAAMHGLNLHCQAREKCDIMPCGLSWGKGWENET